MLLELSEVDLKSLSSSEIDSLSVTLTNEKDLFLEEYAEKQAILNAELEVKLASEQEVRLKDSDYAKKTQTVGR